MEDFSKEMSGIEDVLKNVLKSKVIVYDLARGEIEVDFYLPVDVRTLNSISEISLRKYIPELHSSDEMFTYFREMSSIFLIHMDIIATICMCFYLKELF
jgi:hypothetical protein